MARKFSTFVPISLILLGGGLGGLLAGCNQSNGDAVARQVQEARQSLSTDVAESGAPGKTEEIQIIGYGREVDVQEHVVPGMITVFDFFSQYCGPCVQLEPYLKEMHAKRADIAVVKVDINRPGQRGIDWGSPTAKQYGLNSIPHFKVYGADGRLMADGSKAREMVFNWLAEKES